MESERISGQLHKHSIVHGKVNDWFLGGAGALHRHLIAVQVNLMFFRIADDSAADILIRTRRSQPDLRATLRGKVTQILMELKVGQFA